MLGVVASLLAATSAAGAARDPFNLEIAPSMVGARLRDSRSAKYLSIRYVADNVICGSVNAKNGHGGYTGYVEFAVYSWPNVIDLDPIVASDHKDLFSEVLIGFDERMRESVRALCKED